MASTDIVSRLRSIVRREKPKPDAAHSWAAVAVIINTCLNAILIGKRTINPEDPWSGDAAFPGGRFKQGVDSDLVETAIREAREEVGLDLNSDAELLGVLEPFSPSNAPSISVVPAIFALRNCNPALSINKVELSKVLWLNINDIPKYIKVDVDIKGMKRPAIVMEDMVIWGLTYRILRRILKETIGMVLPRDPRDLD
jgi:ADP-ribose pyrophosphatase